MSFLVSKEWEEPSMERILVPLQGFPAEVNAINLAFNLAEASKARISVLHCKESFTKESEFWLNRLSGHIKSRSVLLNVPYDTEEVKRYRASDAIIKSSQKEECDLIVMSAARTPTYRHHFGSTARRVARKSKVPVLVVVSWLEDFASHQEPVLRKILMPIRSTGKDWSALHLGAALKGSSAAANTELIALNMTLLPLVASLTVVDAPEFQLERKHFMNDVTRLAEQIGIGITAKHAAGRDLGEVAINIANTEQVDLIILGAHQKPHRFGAILGRVSKKIASKAEVAVVIIFL